MASSIQEVDREGDKAAIFLSSLQQQASLLSLHHCEYVQSTCSAACTPPLSLRQLLTDAPSSRWLSLALNFLTSSQSYYIPIPRSRLAKKRADRIETTKTCPPTLNVAAVMPLPKTTKKQRNDPPPPTRRTRFLSRRGLWPNLLHFPPHFSVPL